jgi:hypothetical protein
LRFSTERKIIVLIIIAVIICATSGASSAAKKKKAPDKPALPPYRTSGPIPGTSLIYEKLHISDSGAVTVSIHNPERSGVRFRAAFSFYSAKNEFLTGFGVEGFATASASTGYSLSMKDYKKLRQASYMTVLGRAGRAGGDSWE